MKLKMNLISYYTVCFNYTFYYCVMYICHKYTMYTCDKYTEHNNVNTCHVINDSLYNLWVPLINGLCYNLIF